MNDYFALAWCGEFNNWQRRQCGDICLWSSPQTRFSERGFCVFQITLPIHCALTCSCQRSWSIRFQGNFFMWRSAKSYAALSCLRSFAADVVQGANSKVWNCSNVKQADTNIEDVASLSSRLPYVAAFGNGINIRSERSPSASQLSV